MFEVGDKVVDSGVRAGEGADYLFGEGPEMAPWYRDRAVLTVFGATNPPGVVTAGIRTYANSYHPSELRYATPGEIEAAENFTEGKPKIGPGSVVKRESGAVFVVLREKDDDGDYATARVSGAFDGLTYLKDSDIESVTGTIGEDGMFTPADKASESDGTEECKASERRDARLTWRDLKVGDVIRISDDNRWACNRNRGKLTRVRKIDECATLMNIKVAGLEVDSDWIAGNAGDFEIIERA